MMDTLGIVYWCSMFTCAALFGIGFYDEKFNYPVPLMASICITLATTFAYWVLCCTYCHSSHKKRLRPNTNTAKGSTYPRGSNEDRNSKVDPKKTSSKNRSENTNVDPNRIRSNSDVDNKNKSGNSENMSGNPMVDPKNMSGNSDIDPKNKSGYSDGDFKNKSGNSDPKNMSSNSKVDKSGTDMPSSTTSILNMDIEDLELMIGNYFLWIQLSLANKLKGVMNFCIICGCIAPKVPHLALRFALRLPKLCLRLAIKLPKICFRFVIGTCKFCLSYILRLGKFILRLPKIGFNFCLCKLFKLFRCIKFGLGKIWITIGKVCSLCMGVIKLIPEVNHTDECKDGVCPKKEKNKSRSSKTSSAKFPRNSRERQSSESKGEVKERAGSIIIYRQAEDVEILDLETPHWDLHRGSDEDDEKSLKAATLKKATKSTGLKKDQLNVKSSIDVEWEKKYPDGTKSWVVITYWFAEVSVKTKVKEAKWISKDDYIEDIENENLADQIEKLGQDESESDERSNDSESEDGSDSIWERKRKAFNLNIRGKDAKVERRHGASPKKNSEAHDDDDDDEEFSLWWLLVLGLLLVIGGVVCLYFLRPEWIEAIKSKFTN